MREKRKRTKGIEEAHPFSGLSQVSPNEAGVDIGVVEIVVYVAGKNNTQIVKAQTADAGLGRCAVLVQASPWLIT